MQNYASAEEKGHMVLMDPGQKNRGVKVLGASWLRGKFT